MNLLNIPGLSGLKTIIGSYVQLVAGLLLALAELLHMAADCLSGMAPLDACLDKLPMLFLGVVAAANGLMGLGLGHKIEKSATPS